MSQQEKKKLAAQLARLDAEILAADMALAANREVHERAEAMSVERYRVALTSTRRKQP